MLNVLDNYTDEVILIIHKLFLSCYIHKVIYLKSEKIKIKITCYSVMRR